jgi:hypothetical protein
MWMPPAQPHTGVKKRKKKELRREWQRTAGAVGAAVTAQRARKVRLGERRHTPRWATTHPETARRKCCTSRSRILRPPRGCPHTCRRCGKGGWWAPRPQPGPQRTTPTGPAACLRKWSPQCVCVHCCPSPLFVSVVGVFELHVRMCRFLAGATTHGTLVRTLSHGNYRCFGPRAQLLLAPPHPLLQLPPAQAPRCLVGPPGP